MVEEATEKCRWLIIYVKLCFVCLFVCLFVFSPTAAPLPNWARASSFTRFLDHTQRRTAIRKTTLDEWSAWPKDLYRYNTQHSQQTDIYAPGGIRNNSLTRRAAVDLRLRLHDCCDRLSIFYNCEFIGYLVYPLLQFTVSAVLPMKITPG
jgi:hypothetical protein